MTDVHVIGAAMTPFGKYRNLLTTDGALASPEIARRPEDPSVVRHAGTRTYEKAGLGPDAPHVVEVHDTVPKA